MPLSKTTKINSGYATTSGAAAALVWLLNEIWGVSMPMEVAYAVIAFAGVPIGALVGYLTPDGGPPDG